MAKKKDKEKQLYELVESLGEQHEGEYHVIDISERAAYETYEGKYRFYDKGTGICFDVTKEVEDEDEKTGALTYFYDLSVEWNRPDGFSLTTEAAIKLVQHWKQKEAREAKRILKHNKKV